MKRRRLVIGGLAAAIAVVIAIVVLRSGGRERAFIVGFRALDADGAVIVWRANYKKGKSRSWVTRVDARGIEKWTHALPELALSVGGNGPVIVADNAVVVRYGRLGPESEFRPVSNAAIAFDLASGTRLWDRELVKFEAYTTDDGHRIELRGLPLYVSDLAAGSVIASFSEAGKREVVLGLEARTGKTLWEDSRSSSDAAPMTLASSYVLHNRVDWASWRELLTGKEHSLSPRGVGCVVGKEYVFVRETDRVQLVARSEQGVERVIADPFDLGSGGYVNACGRYRDRFVFLAEVGSFAHERRHVVAITDSNGKRLHEIDVGGRLVMDGILERNPERAWSGDRLPRFMPYPRTIYSKDDRTETLLMLDLESGTIAWQGKPDPRLIHGEMFRAGSYWLWNGGGLAPNIAVFDGATGTLKAAVSAYSYNGVATMGAALSLASTPDTLWLFSGDWTTPDKAPIVALELPSLKPRFPPRIIKLEDAMAAVRERLGLR